MAAQTATWTGHPVTALLDALAHTGVDVLYSSELVPAQLTIKSEPHAGALAAQVAEVLAPNGLEIRPLDPTHFVITRAPVSPSGERIVPSREESAARLEEVTIFASRYAFDRHGLVLPRGMAREQLVESPGTGRDVLRAAQSLPGVATGASSRPYIRGSLPEDVLVVFDHVPIADPFHLKSFQRLISVFDSAVIERMDVLSGNYPARYGTRSGGVIDLAPRALATGHEHAIDFGMQDVAVSSVGHAQQHDVDWLVAARGNLVDMSRKPVGSSFRQSNLIDFLGRLSLETERGSTWTAGTLLMNDHIRLHNRSGDQLATTHSSDQHAWLTYQNSPEANWRQRTTLSAARAEQLHDGSIVRPPMITGMLSESRDFRTLSLDSDWTHVRKDGSSWNIGGGVAGNHGDNIYLRDLGFSPMLARAFGRVASEQLGQRASPRQISEAAYVSYRTVPDRRFDAEIGWRYDAQQVLQQTSQAQWTPRLNLRWHLRSQLDLYGAWGQFSQAQRPDEWRLEEGQVSADHAAIVTHAVIGLALLDAAKVQWRVEVYDKHWTSVSPYFDNLLDAQNLLPTLAADRIRLAPQSADATGLEVSVRRVLPRQLELWGNASLARATDVVLGQRVARSWDQRWSANAGFIWSRNRLSVLGTVRSHAGWPMTPVASLQIGSEEENLQRVLKRNEGRWSPFLSADLRAAWSLPLRSSTLELWTDITNLSNRGNQCCLRLVNLVQGSAARTDVVSWQPRSIDLGVSWRLH